MNTPTPYPSASLYIGDLHPEVTETMLFEIFKTVGPIASLRVCRDAVTRRSLGYGYINFHNPVDAERALDTLNYTAIKGRPCRIMWSHRDPSLRRSGTGNIFIKNLDKSIDHKALYDTFSVFGNILSCKVAQDETGASKGYGFVHYETAEAADLAVQKSNGKLLNGKIVYVGPFVARKERSGGAGDGESEKRYTNIYVKNLSESVNSDRLRTVFEKFGTVTSCVVMTDDQGKSKGFGFINFETPEAAKKAVDEMNNQQFEGKQLFVGRAQKKAEREGELRAKFEALKQERLAKTAGVNLFVKNLDDQIGDEKLKEEFAQYGTITSAKIMRDDKGNSKGFGFVCFSTPDEATKALTEMNGRMFGVKPIYVGLAQRKEVRRSALESTHRGPPLPRVAYPGAGGPGGVYPPLGTFYPPPPGAMPAPGGRGFMYPQMLPRARWAGPGGPPNPGGLARGQPYPPGAFPPGMGAPHPGGGAPRGRGRGRGGGGPSGLPPGAVPVNVGQAGGRPPAGGAPAAAGAAGATPEGGRGFKWTKEARNKEVPEQAAGAGDAAAAPAPTPEERRQQLGETLYPLIETVQPAHAGKITGMLLESLGVPELLELLESPVALNGKIAEAMQVLQAHGKNDAAAATAGTVPEKSS